MYKVIYNVMYQCSDDFKIGTSRSMKRCFAQSLDSNWTKKTETKSVIPLTISFVLDVSKQNIVVLLVIYD